jgi:hypothetical protein
MEQRLHVEFLGCQEVGHNTSSQLNLAFTPADF